MEINGLHILLTYTCTYECDHCFVWGSPWQTGTFSLAQLEEVFRQAADVPTIESIYFEGGEPFLYQPILVEAVRRSKARGYWTGIVSNGYWATGVEDSRAWLRPLAAAGLDRLEVSCDVYHGAGPVDEQVAPALEAARELFLTSDTITIEAPVGERDPGQAEAGQPVVGGDVMYRGRAAEKLTPGLPQQDWTVFDRCPYEDLVEPGRIHLDPLGNLHLCQGIVIGNLFERPLKEILADYEPEKHPIVGPLIAGGPRQLVETYELAHEPAYVDACHLCYRAREALRPRFPEWLGPDQVYGLYGG